MLLFFSYYFFNLLITGSSKLVDYNLKYKLKGWHTIGGLDCLLKTQECAMIKVIVYVLKFARCH